MKFSAGNKYYVFITILIILVAVLFTRNYSTNYVDKSYFDEVTENYKLDTESVYNASKQLLNNLENKPVGNILIEIGNIRADIRRVELSVELIAPHFNIKNKKEHVNMQYFSGLFRLYDLSLLGWQSSIADIEEDGKLRNDKELLKDNIETLIHDFETLKNVDLNSLYNLTYAESNSYWIDIVQGLEAN